jgi:hypothetical protein
LLFLCAFVVTEMSGLPPFFSLAGSSWSSP